MTLLFPLGPGRNKARKNRTPSVLSSFPYSSWSRSLYPTAFNRQTGRSLYPNKEARARGKVDVGRKEVLEKSESRLHFCTLRHLGGHDADMRAPPGISDLFARAAMYLLGGAHCSGDVPTGVGLGCLLLLFILFFFLFFPLGPCLATGTGDGPQASTASSNWPHF